MSQTKGKCSFCSETFTCSEMAQHLQRCASRKQYLNESCLHKGNTTFLIKIFSPEMPDYWLFVEALGSATLKSLDSFLRKTWLECCGHLSCFIINKIHYDAEPPDDDIFGIESRTMNVPLHHVLRSKLTFDHEYDFGTTTYLKLSVVATRQGAIKKPVQLIARNEPPKWNCVFCRKEATEVCAICGLGDSSVLCKKCLAKHKCVDKDWNEEMSLPLVNSPRTGECGYTGK